ncbi:hypothetical protein TNCV_2078361 [Trichonephila clavipes]|nr:hypothetical protein TNCV_2078361 [Trichonephila clavipes]
MLVLKLCRERDEVPIVTEALGPGSVGLCRKTSLAIMKVSHTYVNEYTVTVSQDFIIQFGKHCFQSAFRRDSSKPEADESHVVRDQDCDIGAPNQ